MMIYIDTHLHLYDVKYDVDRAAVVVAARGVGVDRVYLPNINLATIKPMLSLVAEYPDFCFPMLGLHPCDVKGGFAQQLVEMEKWWATGRFVGIGEVGLDLYWDRTFYKEQVVVLHRMIDWALAYDLPLILHARNSLPELIKILKARQNGKLRGIVHCFSGTLAEANEVISLGFLLGIGGSLTYKKSLLPVILAEIDLAHVVLETDGPYLPPVPYRGERNEPAYLPIIAEKIAEIKNIPVKVVAKLTTANARKLFG